MNTKMQKRMWLVTSFVLILGLAAGLLAFTPTGQAAAARNEMDDLPEDAILIPGEIVVTFPTGTSLKSTQAKAAALAGEVGAQVAQTYAHLAVLSVDPAADVAALATQITDRAGGAYYAQPNYIYRIPEPIVSASSPAVSVRQEVTAEGGADGISWDALASMRQLVRKGGRTQSIPIVPNDGKPAWGWDQIQADYIWDDKTASPLVCLVDTGVDYRHPDLKGKVIKGPDLYNMDKEPDDSSGHGTHLAGIISANMNNGEDTAVGVSNSKILAVKVAGSNGWGSTFSVAAGLYYCANNTSVRIINLSMGAHHPDNLIYDSLDYAINTKSKLVVAAAGNDARSAIMEWAHDRLDWRNHPAFYPAGWADSNVGWNDQNWVAYNPDDDPNQPDNAIYHGLISVGATRHENGHEDGSDYWLWVDTNENDAMDEWENYNYGRNCLTWFSNYGRWVNMTAPGQSIYSTTPVSYPFAMNYYDWLDVGYGWLEGTSQAAAFVTGAAARVWSLDKYQTNDDIKTRLVESGHDPADFYGSDHFAVDETIAEPWIAYADGDKYGWFDEDEGDPNDNYERLPFCYPTIYDDEDGIPNSFQASEDMSGTRILNVAAAMNRFRIYANARDAFTGLPLDGATAQIKLGTKVVDKIKIVTNRDEYFSVIFNNVPYQDGGVYQYQVSKKGYTAGFQTYYQFTLDALDPSGPVPGSGVAEAYGSVSVPPSHANLHAVLDWVSLPWMEEMQGSNLDLYLWMPDNFPVGDPNAQGSVINHGRLFGEYQPAYDIYPSPHPWEGWDGNGGEGTLLDPPQYTFNPDETSVYAQHVFERWGDDRAPTETITIRANKGLPWYLGDYTFMVTDYSANYPDGGFGDEPDRLDIDGEGFVSPTMRLWMKGKILSTVSLDSDVADAKCYDDGVDADFWKALTVNGITYTTSQECGTAELPGEGDSIFPY